MIPILVVDDDPSFRALLRDILESAGYAVTEASSAEQALSRLDETSFAAVLTDQRMPGLSGIELLSRIRGSAKAPPVVLLTAHGTIPDAVEAIRLGAADYISKPLPSPGALIELLERIVTDGGDDEDIVASDAKMLALLDLVDRAAGRDVPVLVTGESGTGKELVARRIHRRSSRSSQPFVAVNCASLPESLAESELFGHEKGSFTGADRLRRGRFEEAHRGVLFLDEVGELPLSMQPKLLRVLEEGRVRRVGGSQDVAVDVRIVAATNRQLEQQIEKGLFRPDLYYRLNVVSVVIPPLRERRGDVLPIATRLLERIAERHGVASPSLSKRAEEALVANDWPGNVRELRNVLERAVVVRGAGEIEPGDLALPGDSTSESNLQERYERDAVIEALRRTGGNREAAARMLGVSVRTLYYRLRRLGLT
ncbi:MAG: sigma-54-dependent transcriptional regulator [Thermoanaerobaculia bacterium]